MLLLRVFVTDVQIGLPRGVQAPTFCRALLLPAAANALRPCHRHPALPTWQLTYCHTNSPNTTNLTSARFCASREDQACFTSCQPLPQESNCYATTASAGNLTAVGELSSEQRTVLKEHGLAWVLFLTPEAQVCFCEHSRPLLEMLLVPCHCFLSVSDRVAVY
jgi:hypothetical protein